MGGRRSGRSHRQQDVPCQDAYAIFQDADGQRAVAAVADGLGSRPFSHYGSQVACDAAVASLGAEETWDNDALVRAFSAARDAIAAEAKRRELPIDALATTLQVAAAHAGRVIAGMVGDGAIVAGSPATILLAPAQGGYANEVTPLTSSQWREHLQIASHEGATSVLLFSDGLTRLLLARKRQEWQPHAPFFDAFLPALGAADPDAEIVQKFLDGDAVDSSWDDDKALAVIAVANPA